MTLSAAAARASSVACCLALAAACGPTGDAPLDFNPGPGDGCGDVDGGTVWTSPAAPSARPLALVGDLRSDAIQLFAPSGDALPLAGCRSVDEHPFFVDEPWDLALAPARDTFYVVLGHAAGYVEGTLLELRLADGAKLGEVALGAEPSTVALSADGRRAYVSLFRNLSMPMGPTWPEAGALVTVDTERMAVIGQVDVCAAGLGTALDEPRGRVWVACLGADALALVDVAGKDEQPTLAQVIPLDDGKGGKGTAPAHVLLDGKHVFVTAQGTGELWIFDAATAAYVTHLPFGADSFPQRMALLPDGSEVIVALDGSSQLARVATDALLTIDRIPIDGVHPEGVAVAKDGRTLYVTDEADLVQPGRLVRVDRLTHHVDATAETRVMPQAVVLVE